MTYLSHQDGPHTQETSYKLAERLDFWDSDVEELNSSLRRAAHIVVFAVFAVLLTLTVRTGGWNRMVLMFPFVWAVLDEATKPFIQGRHFAWYDVGLNELGVILGYMAMVCLKLL